jgi:mono/diheme cytochrome c family protein
VEGTVARGDLREDTYFYTGKIGAGDGDYLPFPVTEQVLTRGRERFDIFCAPCHGRVGDGNGFIPSRGLRRPPSYHIERLRKVPTGYFFDVMTNGFGIMPDYSSQVPPEDRWKIAAYIRALQLSQGATSADIPAGQKVPSPAPEFRDIGTGATLPEVKPPSKDASGESKEEPK